MPNSRKLAENIITFCIQNKDQLDNDPESAIEYVKNMIDIQSKTEEDVFYTAYFDGSAIPNPGQMKIGGYIKENGNVVASFSEEIGPGTNNQAEYLALIHLLDEALHLKIKRIQVFGDSEFVIKQVKGEYRVNRKKFPHIAKLYDAAIDRVRQFNSIELSHVPREQNRAADRLTR
jgi:ribonuclease HI